MVVQETQQQIEQAQQELETAQQQAQQFNPRIQQTQQQLRQATPSSQIKVQQQEAQRSQAQQQAIQQIQQQQQNISQSEEQFQEWLKTPSGIISYAQEAGIQPQVTWVKPARGYAEVKVYTYNTPYGTYTDDTEVQRARGEQTTSIQYPSTSPEAQQKLAAKYGDYKQYLGAEAKAIENQAYQELVRGIQAGEYAGTITKDKLGNIQVNLPETIQGNGYQQYLQQSQNLAASTKYTQNQPQTFEQAIGYNQQKTPFDTMFTSTKYGVQVGQGQGLLGTKIPTLEQFKQAVDYKSTPFDSLFSTKPEVYATGQRFRELVGSERPITERLTVRNVLADVAMSPLRAPTKLIGIAAQRVREAIEKTLTKVGVGGYTIPERKVYQTQTIGGGETMIPEYKGNYAKEIGGITEFSLKTAPYLYGPTGLILGVGDIYGGTKVVINKNLDPMSRLGGLAQAGISSVYVGAITKGYLTKPILEYTITKPKEPSFLGLQKSAVTDEGLITKQKYIISQEVPGIEVKATNRLRDWLGIKPIVEGKITKTKQFVQETPFFNIKEPVPVVRYRVGAKYGKISFIEGGGEELTTANLLSTSPTEKYILSNIPKKILTDKSIKLERGYITDELFAKANPSKRTTEFFKPTGKLTSQFEVISASKKISSGKLPFDTYAQKLYFKDVTKPLSRATGKIPTMSGATFVIREPIDLTTSKILSKSKTIQSQVQKQVQELAIPKLPPPKQVTPKIPRELLTLPKKEVLFNINLNEGKLSTSQVPQVKEETIPKTSRGITGLTISEKQPTKEKQIIIPKIKEVQVIVPKLNTKYKTNQVNILKLNEGNKVSTALTPITKVAELEKLADISKLNEIQGLTQVQEQKLSQPQRLIQNQIQTPTTPTIIPKPSILIPTNQKSKQFLKAPYPKKDVFTVEIRRRGKFKQLAKTKDIGTAVSLGKTEARKTLGASIRVRGAKGYIPLAPSQEFRKSKNMKDPFSLIQMPIARLTSRTERIEIISSRRKAQPKFI